VLKCRYFLRKYYAVQIFSFIAIIIFQTLIPKGLHISLAAFMFSFVTHSTFKKVESSLVTNWPFFFFFLCFLLFEDFNNKEVKGYEIRLLAYPFRDSYYKNRYTIGQFTAMPAEPYGALPGPVIHPFSTNPLVLAEGSIDFVYFWNKFGGNLEKTIL
jgi:hypothetical protein